MVHLLGSTLDCMWGSIEERNSVSTSAANNRNDTNDFAQNLQQLECLMDSSLEKPTAVNSSLVYSMTLRLVFLWGCNLVHSSASMKGSPLDWQMAVRVWNMKT